MAEVGLVLVAVVLGVLFIGTAFSIWITEKTLKGEDHDDQPSGRPV
jgi:hypothetical protein